MRRLSLMLAVAGLLIAGCGKKGPPLPPLVRVAAAPPEFSAHRQGAQVTLRFTVPSANADGSTPADVTHVDVYAMNGLAVLTADDVVRRGTKVGTVTVNPPPDPDLPEDDPVNKAKKLPGALDQGAAATLTEMLTLADASPDDVRSYVAVGFTRRGRRGPATPPALVPLVAAPPAPPAPAIAYDEKAVTATWTSGPLGVHVYVASTPEMRLTPEAVTGGTFVEPNVEYDVERCYVLRTIVDVAAVTIESEASPRACVTPRDSFPPASPTGLNAVPETGAVSLIWNPVEAPDLAGYLVLRAIAPSTVPEAITTAPLADTTFRDAGVPSGSRVTYAIVAVDKSGNRSPASASIVESVR